MRMVKNIVMMILVLLSVVSCSQKKDTSIDENRLGIVDADVNSDETNLKEKARFTDAKPGKAETFNRSFENAPPLIPHTVEGFLPIKIESNICLSCHMPDKVEETGAVAIPKMHFTNLRPALHEEKGIYYFANIDTLVRVEIDRLNNAFFNCTQCHVPQAKVKVNIENLFTPEFREKFGIEKSNLEKQFEDGL